MRRRSQRVGRELLGRKELIASAGGERRQHGGYREAEQERRHDQRDPERSVRRIGHTGTGDDCAD